MSGDIHFLLGRPILVLFGNFGISTPHQLFSFGHLRVQKMTQILTTFWPTFWPLFSLFMILAVFVLYSPLRISVLTGPDFSVRKGVQKWPQKWSFWTSGTSSPVHIHRYTYPRDHLLCEVPRPQIQGPGSWIQGPGPRHLGMTHGYLGYVRMRARPSQPHSNPPQICCIPPLMGYARLGDFPREAMTHTRNACMPYTQLLVPRHSECPRGTDVTHKAGRIGIMRRVMLPCTSARTVAQALHYDHTDDRRCAEPDVVRYQSSGIRGEHAPVPVYVYTCITCIMYARHGLPGAKCYLVGCG